MAEMTRLENTFDPEFTIDLAIRYTAIRMWTDLVAKLDFQPANKASFIAVVEPEIRKAFNERTKREGGLPASPVDTEPTVGGQLEPGVPGEDHEHRFSANNRTCYCGVRQDEFRASQRFPACEWGGGVCR